MLPRHLMAGLAIAATLTTACGDSVGPPPIIGTFGLSAINNAPPPALVGSTVNCDQFLTNANLVLMEGGQFTLDAEYSLDCSRSGGGTTPSTLSAGGTYIQAGRAVTFNLSGGYYLRGTLSGTTLSGTIPASPFTFPTDVVATFTLVEVRAA